MRKDRSAKIDTARKFAHWVHDRQNEILEGKANEAPILREAFLIFLRVTTGAAKEMKDALITEPAISFLGRLRDLCYAMNEETKLAAPAQTAATVNQSKGPIGSQISELRDQVTRIEKMICRLIGQSQPPAGGQFLSVKEVADRFGVSTGTIRGLVDSGKLTASRVGKGRGTLRFDPAELERFQHESTGALTKRRSRWP